MASRKQPIGFGTENAKSVIGPSQSIVNGDT